jgi:hypothetical protein
MIYKLQMVFILLNVPFSNTDYQLDYTKKTVFVKNIEQKDPSRTADIISINCFTSVKFQFNPNNIQFNQTFTNCLIKNVTDTLPT